MDEEDKCLSHHFKESEFRCKCCGSLPEGGISKELIAVLETIREEFGSPITINSGYRCPKKNAAVDGAKNSQHMLGTAADITVSGVEPDVVYAFANRINNNGGVGRYKTFTHVDTRGYYARWVG